MSHFNKGAIALQRMLLGLGSLAVLVPLMPGEGFAGSAKVNVCHVPPGNPGGFHTITVGENALPAHLAHGDFAGNCNDLCATLCNDGDACTIDDEGTCEQQGCPTTPVAVDCDDGLSCTNDSCNSASGCLNQPVVCEAGPCTVAACDESSGGCVQTPVVCDAGESCNPETGECEATAAPCRADCAAEIDAWIALPNNTIAFASENDLIGGPLTDGEFPLCLGLEACTFAPGVWFCNIEIFDLTEGEARACIDYALAEWESDQAGNGN